MKKIRLNKKKGILFWITGLSGSGKTSIAKLIKKDIVEKYGPTIVLSGDDLRKIFKLNKYDRLSRLENGLKFSNFCKKITDQKINVIFAVVGMFDKIRSQNKKNIKNYVEIFIQSNLKKIIKKRKKKIYHKGITNIVGLDIKPELPKKPNLIIKNDFKKRLENLSKKVFLEFSDHRFKYFASDQHTTLSVARNQAIKQSKGEIIAFLDTDDWWDKNKLEKQISHFKDQEVGLVHSNFYLFYENIANFA